MSRKSNPRIKTNSSRSSGVRPSKRSIPSRHSSSSSSSSSSSVAIVDVKNLSNISTAVYDCCCFVFYCPKHEQVLLTKGNLKFFPHAQLSPARTWFECSIEAALGLLLGPISPQESARLQLNLPFERFTLVHLFRFQLPQSQRFITRLVYLVELKADSNSVPCCQDTSGLRWFPLADVASSAVPSLSGPEVSYFASIIKSKGKVANPQVEYSLTDAYKYIMADRPEEEKPLSAMLVMLTVNDIERLYADFIEHAFPSFFLTRDSFLVYMQRHEIETDHKVISRYFRTFRLRGKQYLQFTELLLGLASLDNRTPHADSRVKYVFRYYDQDRDGRLSVAEFKHLLRDLNPEVTQTDREVREEMHRIGIITVAGRELITYESFKRAVGSHLFRGTSRLCRARVSPFAQITRSLAARKLGKIVDTNLRLVLQNRRYPGVCSECSAATPYKLASTMVTLGEGGRFVRGKRILPKRSHPDEEAFSTDSILHFLQERIREFNRHKGTPRRFKGLFADISAAKMRLFFQDVQKICIEVGRLVEQEDRVLSVSDPCYVIGDIHGNLEDLLTLEATLWRGMPFLTANYLFLGDFVDRGKWSFECFLYLAIMKLRCPSKVFLLRGNHEVRSIQMKYSFHEELMVKYGSYGQTFFDTVNYVFDRLPFCAVINYSIFAAHGGIPCSTIDLETLNQSTPHCVQNPEVEAITIWEVLWSDPLEFARFEETARLQGLTVSTADASFMYLPNIKRGTSYLFSEYALFAFLNHNSLQYMVRAHEVPADGFKWNFGRFCTTIFSCSHYCKNDNEAAAMLVEREGRLRILRIDTSNNNTAMEA